MRDLASAFLLMSTGSSTPLPDADAETAEVEDVIASGNSFSENDSIAGELGHVTGVSDASISTAQEANMTTSPGLQQEHTISSSAIDDMSSDSAMFVGHKSSAMTANLVNVRQVGPIIGTVPSEFPVNDTVVPQQRFIRGARSGAHEAVIQEGSSSLTAALPADGTEDFRIESSVPVSALEGIGSAYFMQDSNTQDVAMTDAFLDDDHFIFPAMDAEKEVNSWQASDDVSMEGKSLAGCDEEEQAALGTQRAQDEANMDMVLDKNVACDEAEMGAQGPSCEEVPNQKIVAKQPVIGTNHSVLHVSTAEDMESSPASFETKEDSLNHIIPGPQTASLVAPHEDNHTILVDTSEDAPRSQYEHDKDPSHPVILVENTDNYTKTPSNAETSQALIETATMESQVGIQNEAVVYVTREAELKQESLDAAFSSTQLLFYKKDKGITLVTEGKHQVVSTDVASSDVLPPTDVPAGAFSKEALLEDVELATVFNVAREEDMFKQDGHVPSSIRVHMLSTDELGSATHEKLLLMSEKIVNEICDGCEVTKNEEELVIIAPEQGEDQSSEQVDEPVKAHHELDHECSVQEGVEGMQVQEPINGPVEVLINKHSKPVGKSSVQKAMDEEAIISSIRFSELATSSIVMAECVNPCKEVNNVEKKDEEKGLHGDENLALQVGKMEGETSVEDGGGGESPALQSMALLEASNEDDEGTHPEGHEDHKVPKETSVMQVEALTKAKQSGGEKVEEGNDEKGSSSEHVWKQRSSKKIKKACKGATIFSIGDMVWAKVKSHPWWPAKIFDPADASKAARKLKKPGRALVAFFGDGTFAWLEQAQMIAFRPNFEEKVKQTIMRSFCVAVEEALEEACKCSELSLHCEHYRGPLHSRSTFPDANTGIREGVRLDGHRDRSTSLDMFRPDKTVEFVKAVACSPLGSWSWVLSLLELRGHAYGVRTCMVALRHGDGTSLVETAVSAQASKAKRTFSSLKTDEELVVESGNKHSKRLKIGKGSRPSAGKGEGSDTTQDGKETLVMPLGSKASKTSGKKEGGSSRKVRRHTLGATKEAITTSSAEKAGRVWRGDSEPSTPTRTESRAEDAFVSSPRSDGEDVGSKGIKKLSHILQMGPQPDAKKTSNTVNYTQMNQDDHEKDASGKTKYNKVGDSIKKVAGQLTRMPPSKHVDELLAKSSKPGPKKQKHDLASQLQSSPSKGGKAVTMGMIEKDSSRKAGRQNASHKSQKSRVQELALAARKRKSELLHKEVVSKAPKMTVSLGVQHASKVVTRSTQEKPSDQRSSFEKSSLRYSKRQDMKGSSERLDEKLSSHLPLGLFMRFPEDFPLPSESQLKAIFIPFGPLQVSATRLYKESSSAQVVFKHGRDAESAMKHAKKNALFGPVTVTYRLRHLVHSVKAEAKMVAGKSSMASARKPTSIKEREGPEGPRSSLQEEIKQDVGGRASGAIPIMSDDTAETLTSDIQDKMMTLLRQVSVIVNPSPVPSDGT